MPSKTRRRVSSFRVALITNMASRRVAADELTSRQSLSYEEDARGSARMRMCLYGLRLFVGKGEGAETTGDDG